MNAALMAQIQSGKALKKVAEHEKNDRSAALGAGNVHGSKTKLGNVCSTGAKTFAPNFKNNSASHGALPHLSAAQSQPTRPHLNGHAAAPLSMADEMNAMFAKKRQQKSSPNLVQNTEIVSNSSTDSSNYSYTSVKKGKSKMWTGSNSRPSSNGYQMNTLPGLGGASNGPNIAPPPPGAPPPMQNGFHSQKPAVTRKTKFPPPPPPNKKGPPPLPNTKPAIKPPASQNTYNLSPPKPSAKPKINNSQYPTQSNSNYQSQVNSTQNQLAHLRDNKPKNFQPPQRKSSLSGEFPRMNPTSVAASLTKLPHEPTPKPPSQVKPAPPPPPTISKTQSHNQSTDFTSGTLTTRRKAPPPPKTKPNTNKLKHNVSIGPNGERKPVPPVPPPNKRSLPVIPKNPNLTPASSSNLSHNQSQTPTAQCHNYYSVANSNTKNYQNLQKSSSHQYQIANQNQNHHPNQVNENLPNSQHPPTLPPPNNKPKLDIHLSKTNSNSNSNLPTTNSTNTFNTKTSKPYPPPHDYYSFQNLSIIGRFKFDDVNCLPLPEKFDNENLQKTLISHLSAVRETNKNNNSQMNK